MAMYVSYGDLFADSHMVRGYYVHTHFTLVNTILHDVQHISHNFTSLHTFTIFL